MPAMVVALVCLSVYRVTRFIVADAFPLMANARDAVANRFGPDSWQAYLVECPWCVSIYVGAAAVALAQVAGVDFPVPVAVWLTSSAVAGLIAAYEP